MNDDPWAVLDLEPGASQEEVRRAWRAAAARCHPDRGGDPEEFRVAKAAYEFLSQVAPDGAQDRGGGSEGQPPRPAEPPPGPWEGAGGPRRAEDEGPVGAEWRAGARLAPGQWLFPFGVGHLVREGLAVPFRLVRALARGLDRSAAWAASQMHRTGSPTSLQEVLEPLWLWLALTPLVAVAWFAAALVADYFDSSGAAAFASAVAMGSWWALVGLHGAARVAGRARAWWHRTAWGPQGRAAGRAVRLERRVGHKRARWGV